MKQIRADCSQIDIADIKGTLLFFFCSLFCSHAVSGKYHIPRIDCFLLPVELLSNLKIYRIKFTIHCYPTLLFSEVQSIWRLISEFKFMFCIKVGWHKEQCILKLLSTFCGNPWKRFEKSLDENLNWAQAPRDTCSKQKLEWRHQVWKAVYTGNPKVSVF